MSRESITFSFLPFTSYLRSTMEYAQGRSDNRYLFTGKEYDPESGVYYFGARYYDSKAGRWLARDVKEEFFSSYVYCGNNPLLYIDPNGKEYNAADQLLIGLCATPDQLEKINPDMAQELYNSPRINKATVLQGVGEMLQYGVELNGIITNVLGYSVIIAPDAASKALFLEMCMMSDMIGIALVSGQVKLGDAGYYELGYTVGSVMVSSMVGTLVEGKFGTFSPTTKNANGFRKRGKFSSRSDGEAGQDIQGGITLLKYQIDDYVTGDIEDDN